MSHTSLVPFFSDFISFILTIADKKEDNDASDVTSRALAMLEGGKRDIEQVHICGKSEYTEVIFALVAWGDEVIAKEKQRPSGFENLQMRFFGTTNAGHEFFKKLDAIPREQYHVREIFYLVLNFGFVGEYYRQDDRDALKEIKEQQRGLLGIQKIAPSDVKSHYITPQPYDISKDQEKIIPKNWLPYIIAGIVSLLLLSILAWYLLRPNSNSQIKKDVEALFPKYECSDLHVDVNDDRIVTISGFIDTAGHEDELLKQIRNVEDVTDAESMLDKHISPHCTIAKLLLPYLDDTVEKDGTNGWIKVHKRAKDLIVGQPLLFDVNARDGGYLYIDFYNRKNEVFHIFPHKNVHKSAQRPAKDQWIIGEREKYKVTEPAGEELITVMSSPEKLFDEHEFHEDASDYIEAVKAVLEKKGDTVKAQILFIQTKK